MKQQILLVVLILTGSGNNFEDIFRDDYRNAGNILYQHLPMIENVTSYYGNDPELLSSIVFPELIRYSMFRNYLESTTLDIVYANTGEVDFSIGYFQMKPSFAQKVEEYIDKHTILNSKQERVFVYRKDMKPHHVRKERLRRLKDIEYQVHYLNAFVLIMFDRFPWLEKKDKEYQVRFLSTAYNHNFEAGKRAIKAYMKQEHFPVKRAGQKIYLNYSDIAAYFFNNNSISDSN
jgi:hypothetical protein